MHQNKNKTNSNPLWRQVQIQEIFPQFFLNKQALPTDIYRVQCAYSIQPLAYAMAVQRCRSCRQPTAATSAVEGSLQLQFKPSVVRIVVHLDKPIINILGLLSV